MKDHPVVPGVPVMPVAPPVALSQVDLHISLEHLTSLGHQQSIPEVGARLSAGTTRVQDPDSLALDGGQGLQGVLATSKSGTQWEPRDQGLDGGLVSSLRALL